MLEHIPELIDAGIDSFKIEGRMKTALYVATVARTYRRAIDDYFKDPALYESNMEYYRSEIRKCTYREFSTGFYFGKPTYENQIYDANTYASEAVYLGTVEEIDERGFAVITQKNKFCAGDVIEIMKVNGDNEQTEVIRILDGEGNERPSAPHPQEKLYLHLSVLPEPGDLLRVPGTR